MTGYLWLCEKCDGHGTRVRAWNHRMKQFEDSMAEPGMRFVTYFGDIRPEFVFCEQCRGRGYWEP